MAKSLLSVYPLGESARHAVTHDTRQAIDQPWSVVRFLVTEALRQFTLTTGRKPRLLYVPPIVEACLQVDFARSFDQHVPLSEQTTLFGIPVVWDADEFRVE